MRPISAQHLNSNWQGAQVGVDASKSMEYSHDAVQDAVDDLVAWRHQGKKYNLHTNGNTSDSWNSKSNMSISEHVLFDSLQQSKATARTRPSKQHPRLSSAFLLPFFRLSSAFLPHLLACVDYHR